MNKPIIPLIVIFLFYLAACDSQADKKIQTADTTSIEPDSTVIDSSVTDTVDISSLKEETLWERYYLARSHSKQALSENDYPLAREHLLAAAKYAKVLNRDDIAAWQLNNMGYYAIQQFKKETNYQQRIKNIETMPLGYPKKAYISETKQIFKDHLNLLKKANNYLEEAYELDSQYNDDERTNKIYSNLKFVDWVFNFLREK